MAAPGNHEDAPHVFVVFLWPWAPKQQTKRPLRRRPWAPKQHLKGHCEGGYNRHMRVIAGLALFLICIATVGAQPRPSGVLTPQVESILKRIKASDTGQLAVSEEDGRFLRVLVATRAAKSILEIGAASGYSGIWLGLGARESGGRVVAIEYDPRRAREAAENVRKTGLSDVVRVVEGDAF
jgi:hypothetical protein